MKSKIDIINKLKKKLNAVILGHNYQSPEVQDISDFTGDSLELSKQASRTGADVIIFCGVDFMAETAKILSPGKKVILPVRNATCPMANMITPQQLRDLKAENPGAPAVTYVNTTAAVKAESDVCCTSSNAVRIVGTLEQDKVIFAPDRNLAHYVSTRVDKHIVSWPGYCYVHNSITALDAAGAREAHPDAVLMVHPECRPEVAVMADHVVSTGQMFSLVENSKAKSFIVGTEEGMLYPLGKRFPDREFFPIGPGFICKNMKKITLDKVIKSMKELEPEITVPPETIEKAASALGRMLELS
ncbi:MAG: quinolinate synthase NadA [Elusimicrobia bacterium]|nr:quinolinate synthase NadA [Elusimicrobiota bacterium]